MLANGHLHRPASWSSPHLVREQARSYRFGRWLGWHPEYPLAIGSAAMPFVGASLLANGHLHRPPPRSAPHLVREQARSYRTGRWLAWHAEQFFGLNPADRPFVGASLLANGHLRRPAPWSSLHLVREQARSYRIGRWLAWHTEQSFGLDLADRPFVGASLLAKWRRGDWIMRAPLRVHALMFTARHGRGCSAYIAIPIGAAIWHIATAGSGVLHPRLGWSSAQ